MIVVYFVIKVIHTAKNLLVDYSHWNVITCEFQALRSTGTLSTEWVVYHRIFSFMHHLIDKVNPLPLSSMRLTISSLQSSEIYELNPNSALMWCLCRRSRFMDLGAALWVAVGPRIEHSLHCKKKEEKDLMKAAKAVKHKPGKIWKSIDTARLCLISCLENTFAPSERIGSHLLYYFLTRSSWL